MKEQLVEIIDGMTENQKLWLLTFLNRIFGRAGDTNA